ncbi:hypothetical protein ACFQ3N_03230 [Virgibacillus byunsanensis]|uniref:RNA polymerase sigma factor 54 DNA-binding domain-containing protein n=1 Tax=Virgibacillus byunsanensis TaxID=570945 RepID=A0ABW3LJ01_9BACI
MLNHTNETTKYIKDYYKKYTWLVNSIQKRKSTIYKITKLIVDKQQDFLKNGFAALKPLTLKEVAEEVNMHESTVSRATSNKVIRTPNGSFEMRRLFTSKLKGGDGNSESSTKVKILLKQLIDEEDTIKPFSDQKIADYLNKTIRIAISRRTVSKYRKELNILPSSKRKSFF